MFALHKIPMTTSTRLPDDSPKETVAAAILSIIIHLLIVLSFTAFIAIPVFETKLPPPPATPLEITMIAPEPPKPPVPRFVQTTPQANPPEPTKTATFESDNNTRAASNAPASGSDPLPSVAGKDLPGMDFENKNYTPGSKPQAAAPAAQPVQTPQPTPAPAATPESAPAPPSELALLELPKAKPTPSPQAKKTVPQQKTQPPAATGYQPETRITRIRGNISNRGRPSVDAVATPLGRYRKMVSDAIGSRWYYYVNEQLGLLNIGTVDIRFTVMPDGKVKAVQVLHNTSNESFASVSINAILRAEIPPIPAEVSKLLENGRIEIDYTFTILGN